MKGSKRLKRAITLGGGGPAAGLHIGALRFLKEQGIDFDIWALSCIGAWVGVVYHQCEEGREIEETYKFFHDAVFRDDQSYRKFPDKLGLRARSRCVRQRVLKFPVGSGKLQGPIVARKSRGGRDRYAFVPHRPSKWNEGDFNRFVLNDMLAVNPASRFLTSLLYLSHVTGISRIHYPKAAFSQRSTSRSWRRRASRSCITMPGTSRGPRKPSPAIRCIASCLPTRK